MRNVSVLVLTGALIACRAAHAQVVTPSAEPATAAQPAQAPPAAQATPAPAPAPSAPAKRESRRDEVRAMEVFLTQALQKGAQDLARQLKVSEPNSAFVTGTGRARGFVLDGYGMFFDVDVPGMRQSVVWSAQMLQLEQERQDMLRFLATAGPDDPRRKMAAARLRQVEQQMGAPTGTILLTNPTAAGNADADMMLPPPGRVGAATIPIAEGATGAPPAVALAQAQPIQPVQQPRDPNELYTDSVKNALIDVMLRYSGFLKIRDDEWLTVAASDSDGPQAPGQLEETSRILISVRGSDLAAFLSGKLTREEVLKKVEVREF